MGNELLAFVAGAVTLLNPCILPILPIVVGAALQEDRRAPVALAMGLTASLSSLGVLILAFGFSIGLTQDVLRLIGGGLFAMFGIVLLVPQLQQGLTAAAGPMTAGANRLLVATSGTGLRGQFAIGVLLGLVWTPCVGPTLGVAIASASRGENLLSAILIFAMFGIGVSTSLLAFAYGSRATIMARRQALRSMAHWGRPIFGTVLLAVGVLILTDLDKRIEAVAVDMAPDWLLRFTTAF